LKEPCGARAMRELRARRNKRTRVMRPHALSHPQLRACHNQRARDVSGHTRTRCHVCVSRVCASARRRAVWCARQQGRRKVGQEPRCALRGVFAPTTCPEAQAHISVRRQRNQICTYTRANDDPHVRAHMNQPHECACLFCVFFVITPAASTQSAQQRRNCSICNSCIARMTTRM